GAHRAQRIDVAAVVTQAMHADLASDVLQMRDERVWHGVALGDEVPRRAVPEPLLDGADLLDRVASRGVLDVVREHQRPRAAGGPRGEMGDGRSRGVGDATDDEVD